MTLRDLQYATQDLIDSGAVKDNEKVVAKVMKNKICLYVQTEEGEMEHLATISTFID